MKEIHGLRFVNYENPQSEDWRAKISNKKRKYYQDKVLNMPNQSNVRELK